MGNALGNMKTPSEISFSNTILRTYINFSDPPLKSIKKHQSSSKNSSKLEASTSVKNFSDLSSDDRREINSYLKNVISQIAKSALEDREDEVDTGDDEYLTSKKMKKRKNRHLHQSIHRALQRKRKFFLQMLLGNHQEK